MLWYSLLFACGDKCPEGYEVNEEEKACYPIEEGSDTDTDSTDSGQTDTADTTDTDDDTGTEAVDPFADLDAINGKIIIPSLFEGRLIPRNAFWYQVGSKTLVYMTANRSATCDLAANHLNPNATQQDPSDLFILDHCNMGVVFNDNTDLSTATFFSECTFGTGSFSQQGAEWLWTGTDANGVDAEFYEGFATAGSATDYQLEGERLAVEVSVSEWSGVFPYSNTYNTSVAVGTGAGYIIATECAALSNTIYLEENGQEG
jgi:hypothetical protein